MNKRFVRNIHCHRNALAVALVMGLGFGGVAYGQSTTGNIAGSAPYATGETVHAQSLDQGGSGRDVAVDTDGRFRISSLPTGRYQLSLVGQGGTLVTQTVTVVAGQTVQANLGGVAARSLATVTVSASSLPAIDVNSVEQRTTFTAQRLNTLPIERDVTSVALLTPGTVKGSGYFGNLASFGGSSVAENSYYVNGFNVTNLYDNLSFGQVPYQAIDQLDVQTGGYGAQYGFSTGGVTSANIKRGTNEWKGGVSWTTEPGALRAGSPTTYTNSGIVYDDRSKNTVNDNVYTAWVGGPLVKDKLFLFALGQFENESSTSMGSNSHYSSSSTGASTKSSYKDSTKSPYAVVKLDWNINDNNHLEYTFLNNTQENEYHYYKTSYADGTASLGDYKGTYHVKSGGQTNILKYTGYLTDDLTLSVQYGKMRLNNSSYTVSPDGTRTTYDGNIDSASSGCPYVVYSASYTGTQYGGCSVTSGFGIYGGYDQRKAGRIDLDWKLGDHDIGIGYSDERWKSKYGYAYSGGNYYEYYNDYLLALNYRTGGTVGVRQKSAYVEDHWQVNDKLMLYGGLRDDNFSNTDTDGDTYIKMSHIWQPRLGFSWDVLGDSTLKVYGTAGRYSLPIAANVALRAASPSYYSYTYYTYSGINAATGAPENPELLAGPYYYNAENGKSFNAKSVVTKGLKPYVQDEYILGAQKQLGSDNGFVNDWTLGVKAIYRKLRNGIDDVCDTRPFYAAAEAYGVSDAWSGEYSPPTAMPGCYIYNPGSSVTFYEPLAGTSKLYKVTIPGSELGQKAKRQYEALVFTAEKDTDKYYLNFSYTWSRNFGNTEGLVRSDIGQDDTGTTEDFDFKELMYGSGGYLSNDRRHSIKLYGAYKFTPEWSAGVDVLVQSGTPISCLGGGDDTYGVGFGYEGAYHYCNGRISPTGTSGRTPWTWTVSPNVMYRPAWAEGLSFQLSALNLFNRVTPVQVYQEGEYEDSGTVYTYYKSIYKMPIYYTTPRVVRFQVQYDF